MLPVVMASVSVGLDAMWEGMRGMTCKAVPTHTPTIRNMTKVLFAQPSLFLSESRIVVVVTCVFPVALQTCGKQTTHSIDFLLVFI